VPLDAPVRRILAVKLSSFGDIVHATPCLRALRVAFPDADVRLAIERRWACALRSLPFVDGLVESSSRTRLGPSYFLEVRRALGSCPGRFDLAIDLQGTRRSAAWVYASRARVKAGRGWPRPLWHAAVRPDLSRHAVEVCAEVCRSVAVAVDDLRPELRTSPADEEPVARFLDAEGIPPAGFVLLNPFSRWDSKGLDVATAAELAARTASLVGERVVVTGGPDDAERAASLARRAGARVVSVAGRLALPEALCLLRRARLMISVDSGPMHAAAALGTPVVALFGPTHPERTGPWGTEHVVVQADRPRDHHAYRSDRSRRYIGALTVEAMVAAVERALATSRPESTKAHERHPFTAPVREDALRERGSRERA
jgi:ADP-heptose:LPS heptosyltransferase